MIGDNLLSWVITVFLTAAILRQSHRFVPFMESLRDVLVCTAAILFIVQFVIVGRVFVRYF